ncbi:SAF domain-containing protein [Cohnella fermenti]|uniref:SAF domain-containing protein n=1 Tax=Cohnella fermenti TaxID=2565925 RepID=A0A4S4BIE0_9BACL|nr:SAF domain-containing protein [Cohnella fermenti]THF74381.1 hypothetical protein E6C55_25395 [Cohnella fermenti]
MYRHRKWIVMIAIGIGFLLLVAALSFYMRQQTAQKRELREQLEEQTRAVQTMEHVAKKRVLVLTHALSSGTMIRDTDVAIAEVPEAQAALDSLSEKSAAVGKTVKIDLPQRMTLTASMLADGQPLASDVREQEFNVIQLPTNLKKGQYVDVRIGFPTGEDFIVLSKKRVRDLSGTIVWYDMNESEILLVSSAIIDAYLQGARLYALPYIEPGMQQAAVANYPANTKVLDLMERDPNLLETAKTELARQLRATLNDNLKAMSKADKQQVISGNTTVQQQLQNERVMTEQNNGFVNQSAQQPVNVGSTNSSGVPDSTDSSTARSEKPPANLQGDDTTTGNLAPDTPDVSDSSDVTQNSNADDRLQDVFEQSDAG